MGSNIKNRTFSCIGSLLVNIGLALLFGAVLVFFASQMTQAAEWEFARMQAAGEVPAEGNGTLQNDAPEADIEAMLSDPEVEEESAGPAELISLAAAPAAVEAQKRQPTRLRDRRKQSTLL